MFYMAKTHSCLPYPSEHAPRGSIPTALWWRTGMLAFFFQETCKHELPVDTSCKSANRLCFRQEGKVIKFQVLVHCSWSSLSCIQALQRQWKRREPADCSVPLEMSLSFYFFPFRHPKTDAMLIEASWRMSKP